MTDGTFPKLRTFQGRGTIALTFAIHDVVGGQKLLQLNRDAVGLAVQGRANRVDRCNNHGRRQSGRIRLRWLQTRLSETQGFSAGSLFS